jgi:hypothetical protein
MATSTERAATTTDGGFCDYRTRGIGGAAR